MSTLKERLQTELLNIENSLKGTDSTIHIATFALKSQSCDIDADIAVSLDGVYKKILEAQNNLGEAINLIPEVASIENNQKVTPAKARSIIEAQLQQIFLVVGTLVTLQKALANSDGEHDIAYSDCVRSCNAILDVTVAALDNLAESFPKEEGTNV
jgi:hypothetical protein